MFGVPSGLFQKSPSGPAAVASVDISSELEGEEALSTGSATLADQMLVWFNDIPSGRSIMKRPSWELSQKPPRTASLVQTYVFCYAYWLEHAPSHDDRAHSQEGHSQ